MEVEVEVSRVKLLPDLNPDLKSDRDNVGADSTPLAASALFSANSSSICSSSLNGFWFRIASFSSYACSRSRVAVFSISVVFQISISRDWRASCFRLAVCLRFQRAMSLLSRRLSSQVVLVPSVRDQFSHAAYINKACEISP